MSRPHTVSPTTPGTLEAAACRSCGHFFLPIAPVCPRCWSDRIGRRVLSGQGEVATFTVYRQQYHPDFVPPYVIALIALREGPRMISNVVDCPAEAVRVGMTVRVRFDKRGERQLPLFVPAAAVVDAGPVDPGDKR